MKLSERMDALEARLGKIPRSTLDDVGEFRKDIEELKRVNQLTIETVKQLARDRLDILLLFQAQLPWYVKLWNRFNR